MSNPSTLPRELNGIISMYLRPNEQNNLFNSSKSLRLDGRFYKKIKLSHKYTLQFLIDEAFRNKILSRCEQPENQIQLDASKTNITNEELKILKTVKVYSLNLNCCKNITDVRSLGGVHTLDLSGCRNVSDVSALGGVHTLDLSCCRNVVDVSALGKVHYLCLS